MKWEPLDINCLSFHVLNGIAYDTPRRWSPYTELQIYSWSAKGQYIHMQNKSIHLNSTELNNKHEILKCVNIVSGQRQVTFSVATGGRGRWAAAGLGDAHYIFAGGGARYMRAASTSPINVFPSGTPEATTTAQ